MNTKNKIAMALASLILAGIYLVPIWSINLQAPQYPEGIGLKIWVDKIQGQKKQDLQNINGLNHYIGMKPIHSESIPELKLMPYFFGFLIVSGLGVAVWGNRKALLVWIVLFTVMALAGLIDFYIWEYDYGHNLNPDAPIKIPGMSYQPPLIGTKQLLNMRTTSMPDIGFWLAILSLSIGTTVWWKSRPSKEEDKRNQNEGND
ncbi:MAG: hypothetical protein WD035_10550 [Balneolaceae bacterium]